MAVLYPRAFAQSPPAGFDGLFDWDWLQGCFPRGIMPMDIDASTEINSRFLYFETKSAGMPVPRGQLQALRALLPLDRFTIVYLWGKSPTVTWHWRWERRCVASGIDPRPCTIQIVRDFVRAWSFAADHSFSERATDHQLLRVTFPKTGGERCPF